MPTPRDPDPVLSDRERVAVERLLTSAWDGPVAVDRAEVIWERPHAVRLHATDGREAVMKRPRRDRHGIARDVFFDAWRHERWALSVLDAMPQAIAPRLVGIDDNTLLVVMETLPPGRSVAAALLAHDPDEARRSLVALATSLGEIHVWSRAGETRARELAASSGVLDVEVSVSAALLDGMAALRSASADASIRLPAGDACERELLLAADALAGEGAGAGWRALVHRDPCPDNTRIVGDRCRVFDFERSALGSAAIDVGHLAAPMPTCWCFGRLPDAARAEALAAYMRAAAPGLPVDDLPRQLAFVLGASVISKMTGLAEVLDAERPWGTTGVRPRTLRWLDAFVSLAEEVDELPALRALASTVLDALRDRWPEAIDAWYPAFAPATEAPTVEVPAMWDAEL